MRIPCLPRKFPDVDAEKVQAQLEWKVKTTRTLPTLRRFLEIAGFSSRSEKAQAGDTRVAIVVATMEACRETFGAAGPRLKPSAQLAAFKGVPTEKLTDEIALSYQLQRFYDLQEK